MKTIKISAQVDEHHRLSAQVPASLAPGRVDIVVLLPSEDLDDAGAEWMAGISREWAAELADGRQDIYSPTDGEPVDGAR